MWNGIVALSFRFELSKYHFPYNTLEGSYDVMDLLRVAAQMLVYLMKLLNRIILVSSTKKRSAVCLYQWLKWTLNRT